jgi:ribosomal protein S18 acetylase RimI-like enzyme
VRAADLPRLNAIAWAAKAHRGYRHEQLEAWRADLEVDPHSLAARPVFVAEREGAAVGFVQLATDTEPWEIRALWIDPAHMRRGIGQALMRHACAVAAAAGQREIAIDADPNALGFYTACGARVVGQVAAPLPGDPGRTRPQLRIATAPYKDTARLDATALEDAAQPSLP